ncbi:MAG: ATP-binding protein [Bacteroidota bacterium]
MKTFLISLLALFSFAIQSYGQVLQLDYAPDHEIDLTPYAKVFVDKSANLPLTEIRRKWKKKAFISPDAIELEGKFKRGRYRYWMTCHIQNTHPTDTLLFYLRARLNDTIQVYRFHGNQLVEKFQAGWHVAEDSRFPEYFVPSNSMPVLAIPPLDSSQYYILMRNRMGLHGQPTASLYPIGKLPTKPLKSWINFYLWIGIYLGALLIICLYTFTQFLLTKDKAFLYYSFYVASTIFYFTRELWYGDLLFSLRQISFFSDYEFHTLSSVGIYIFYLLFTAHFLKSQQYYPKLHRFIRWSVVGMIVYAILHQIIIQWDLFLGWQLTYYSKLVTAPIFIYFLIQIWRIKDTLARIIAIGTSLLIGIAFIAMLMSLLLKNTYINNGWWEVTEIVLQVGTLVEMLLFLIGLSYRTKLIADENQVLELNLERENAKSQLLQELNAFKSKLYANLTHEFRTPLTLIKGMTEELKGRFRYQQDEKKLQVIQRNSHRILDLVNQMLELSKIESGQQQIHTTQSDVILFLKYLTDSFQSLAHYNKIMLGFYSTLDELWMDFDQEKIQRIISNLLSNAIKFTEEYGQIKLSAEKVSDDLLEIKVKDTGQGIAREDLTHIFDRFYQVKKDDYEGTGIGLALVKELVHLLKGKIRVHSKIGVGTTFTIQLPIHQKAAKVTLDLKKESKNTLPKITTISPLPETEKAHLLLIEDNQDIINYLLQLLSLRYHIETAKNGEIGIQKALDAPPQLVLCDVMMPRKNGYEVCETLKQHPMTAHIPIILLTARANQEDRLKGLALSADAYLAKPFDKEELLLTIHNLLQKDVLTSPFPKEDNTFLQQFKQVVQTHLSNENLNIALLCKQLKTNRTQLNQQIKSATGKTTMQYVRQLRLQHAYFLLQSTFKSVKEVTFECGFSSVSAFSQAFKEEFGVLASEV